MIVKLLTEHHLEFLSLKGGRTGSSECTLVKMPHCWKSHVMAQLYFSSVQNRTVSYTNSNTRDILRLFYIRKFTKSFEILKIYFQ